jgi:hypothetical protein
METSEGSDGRRDGGAGPTASSSPELDQETDFVLVPSSLAADSSSRNKNINTGYVLNP